MPKPSQSLRDEGFFEFKKSSSGGLCWVKGCSRKSRADRCLCHMHDMRRWRAKQKKTADYCTLRDHAKARGIDFSITLDYWRGLVDAFAYYDPPGDDAALSIDRVDPTKGYVEGNIRVVTVSLNSIKSNKERYLPDHVQHMLERHRANKRRENDKFLRMDNHDASEELELYSEEEEEEDIDCPF